MNQVVLIGHLGNDPETVNAKGKKLCRLSIATTRRWTDDNDQKQERTDWHRVTVWGAQGKACAEHLRKGFKCAVFGRIETDSFEKDGATHWSTQIVASRVEFFVARGPSPSPENAGSRDGSW
jgi:single-strand DNA-binding protein